MLIPSQPLQDDRQELDTWIVCFCVIPRTMSNVQNQRSFRFTGYQEFQGWSMIFQYIQPRNQGLWTHINAFGIFNHIPSKSPIYICIYIYILNIPIFVGVDKSSTGLNYHNPLTWKKRWISRLTIIPVTRATSDQYNSSKHTYPLVI